jgi:hypothetical protein
LQGGGQSSNLISLIRQVIGTPEDRSPLSVFQRKPAGFVFGYGYGSIAGGTPFVGGIAGGRYLGDGFGDSYGYIGIEGGNAFAGGLFPGDPHDGGGGSGIGGGFPIGGFMGGCDCLTGGFPNGSSTAVRGTPGKRPQPAGSRVRSGRAEPPLPEITSGKALNELLDEVRNLHARGFRGPEVGLDEDVVRAIQVGSGRGRDRLAVLKDRGRLEWPTALSGSQFETERVLLGALTSEAIRQSMAGRVDAGTLQEMNAVVEQLRRRLAGSSSAIPKAQDREARDFVAQLEGALQILRQPDAGNSFKQSFAADAKTVAALVQEMTEQGQRFAPAAAGGETAYRTLRQALAAYEEGARSRSSAKGHSPGDSAAAPPNANQGSAPGGNQTSSGYPGQGTGLGGSWPKGQGPQNPAWRKKAPGRRVANRGLRVSRGRDE